jgi:hypothetical protein
MIIILTYQLIADGYVYKVFGITPNIKKRMIKGNSWRYGCPVPLQDLRYLQIAYWDFNGSSKVGELIVHKDVAKSIIDIFHKLYDIKYPIREMRLVSDFKGSDWRSIEADNTSALNCRKITGNKNKWSNHAYGKAIDINPIENPYISKTGYISHKKSLRYRKRIHQKKHIAQDRAIILKYDQITKIFKSYGWRWGGDWKYIKDFQHFEFKK